jgi:hypothetical protein
VQYGTGIDLCDRSDLEADGDKSNEAKRLSADTSQETMAFCSHPQRAARRWKIRLAATVSSRVTVIRMKAMAPPNGQLACWVN